MFEEEPVDTAKRMKAGEAVIDVLGPEMVSKIFGIVGLSSLCHACSRGSFLGFAKAGMTTTRQGYPSNLNIYERTGTKRAYLSVPALSPNCRPNSGIMRALAMVTPRNR